MNHIIIRFPNDNRVINFNKSFLQKYPHSIISAHYEVFPELNEMNLDVTYEEFKILYDIVLGNQKQWQVADHILQLASKFGLISDELCGVRNLLNVKINDTFLRIENFLNSHDELFIPDCITEYFEYKKIFAAKKNIIPFQVVLFNGDICCVNIYDGMPIYFNHCQKAVHTLVQHNIILNEKVDINSIREQMFFDNYVAGDSDVIDDFFDKIYHNNEIIYLKELLNLLIILSGYDSYETVLFKRFKVPTRNITLNIDNTTCDKINNVIKNKKNFFKIGKHNLGNQKYLFDSFSFTESEYYPGIRDYNFYAYCGFIIL